MPRVDIGLAMIAQNEAMHIAASLTQFYHVVQDLVVVDGGSTDETVLWSKRLGARVLHRPFEYDYSAQKNFAIEQLNTEWVYLHDPDERLDPGTIELLPLLVSKQGQRLLMEQDVIPNSPEPFDCFGFARKNLIDGVQTDLYPDYQYRLFKRYCRFEGKVHETITGFENRTEVDYNAPSKISRFNILHYKSRERQEMQNELYKRIRGE